MLLIEKLHLLLLGCLTVESAVHSHLYYLINIRRLAKQQGTLLRWSVIFLPFLENYR
jgi:hypothetical protein